MRKEDTATGPQMRSSHGRNRPWRVGRAVSTQRPMPTSVKASTKRASIISRPTVPGATPITSV